MYLHYITYRACTARHKEWGPQWRYELLIHEEVTPIGELSTFMKLATEAEKPWHNYGIEFVSVSVIEQPDLWGVP